MVNMRWLKGIVIHTKPFSVRTVSPTVEVELENGRRAWAMPHFKLSLRENVLVAWDYTNNCIGVITTKEHLNHMETERDKAESSSMVDVFPNPLDEALEETPNDIGEVSSSSFIVEEGEENSMLDVVDVFQNPSSEDVDSNFIVELRHDIRN